ncbi:MAG: hypothetical protein Q4C91_02520 [Eubacteriales bacterium]|nr:hypothetical protein [Eubacteriales bacterium]
MISGTINSGRNIHEQECDKEICYRSKKLIDSVTDKTGMLGITEKSCSEPITKGADFEVYQAVAGIEVILNKRRPVMIKNYVFMSAKRRQRSAAVSIL